MTPLPEPTPAQIDGSMIPPGLPSDLLTEATGGSAEPAANLAGAKAAARPASPPKTGEAPQPTDEGKTPPGGPAERKRIRAGDLLVHAKETLVGRERGLDIGARADEQAFKELERVKLILEGLPKDDPNIALSHQVLMRLWSDLEAEGNRIIAAREKRAKELGEEYRYKVAEQVEQKYAEVVEGKKVEKTKMVPTGRYVDDTERIIKYRDQLITAITVLDQQQLILSAALEQMLSNNGTRPIEITLPSQEQFELILKERVPGIPEKIWNRITAAYRNKDAAALRILFTSDALAGVATAISRHMLVNGQNVEALVAAGTGLTSVITGIVLSKNSKWITGTPGESAKIVATTPRAEGRVIRTYVDRLGTLGQSPEAVTAQIFGVEKLRAEIFARAGLDLQNSVNQAMLRLDLTSLDTGANTLSGGGGEIWLYNKRQYYIHQLLETEKHVQYLSDLTPEEQLDVVLKAYDLAITEYCGDTIDAILKERDKPTEGILNTDAEAVTAYANKLASGEMSRQTVDKAQVDQAFVEAQVEQSNYERVKGVVERVAEIEQDIPIATREAETAQKVFDLTLRQAGMTTVDYGTRIAETRAQTKTLKGDIDDLRQKLERLKKEKAKGPKNPSGRIKEDIDKERAEKEKQMNEKQNEFDAKIEVINAVNGAEVELLKKTQVLEQLTAELGRHLDSTLVSIDPDKPVRRDPALQARFLAKFQLEVNKKAAEHTRLKGILDSGGEEKHATPEAKLKARQTGRLAAVGSTNPLTVDGHTFEGRYNTVPEAIITQEVTLSELSSRTERGFQLWQELYFGTLTPDVRQEVEHIFTMGEMAKEVVAYFGMDKHPSPRLAELLAVNTGLYQQAEPLAAEFARIKKEGTTKFQKYTSGPLKDKDFNECIEYYEAELGKLTEQVSSNEKELYFEVVPRLGVDRFDTAEFARHMAKRLVEKAKTGEPKASTFRLARFEEPTAVREVGETFTSGFGTASLEETQVEGVRREYARYRFTTPRGFKADGIHDTPLNIDLVIGNPQTAGAPEFSREISLVLTPEWWEALPVTRQEALTLGFPPKLVDIVYAGTQDDSGKKAQNDIEEMGTVVGDEKNFGNNFNSMIGHLGAVRGLGGDANHETTPSHVVSRLQELTYKSIGELLIHGDPNRTTKYFERLMDLQVPISTAGATGENWVISRAVEGFQAKRVNPAGNVEETLSIDKFFNSYESIYRRTRGKGEAELLTDNERKEMGNEIEKLKAELGECAIKALAAVT